MVSKHCRVALGLASFSLHAVTGSAEEPPLAIEWSAPEGCPGRAEVLARVNALLGDGIRNADARAVVRGVVTRSERGASLQLQTRVSRTNRAGSAPSAPVSGERTIAGATCDEVTSAGALVIALAVDPDAVSRDAGTPESEPRVATAPAQAEPVPEAEPAPAAPGSGVAVLASGVAPSPPAAEPSGTKVLVSLRTLLDVGSLPAPALGFRAGVGLERSRVRGELGVGYFLPRFASANSPTDERGADVSLLIGHLRGCYVLVPGRLAIDGCGGAEGGALIAAGEGFDSSTTVTSPWLAAEASAGAAFSLSSQLSVGISAGALVPFGRSTVRSTRTDESAQTYTELYRPSPVSPRLGAGLSFVFR